MSEESSPSRSSLPTPRRSHQKSRRGCKNCKERKVKCDENRPICGKCAIHFKNIYKCDYGDDSPSSEEFTATGSVSRASTASNNITILPKPAQSNIFLLTRSWSPTAAVDPFSQHPPSREPDIPLLMGTYFSSHIFNIFPYYPTPALNPVLEYFAPMISKDPVLFHVSLLVSAFHMEKHLAPKDRARCMRLSKECLDLIQDRINEPFPNCVSDETLAAVNGLAVIEHEKGSLRLSRIHVMGLKRMLEVRGGLQAVRNSNPTIANMLFCMFVSAAEVEFPSSDLEIPISRPAWFYHSLQVDQSQADDDRPINFQAHGVAGTCAELMLNIRMLAKTCQTAQDCTSAQEYQDVLTFLCATLQRLLSLPVPEPLLGYDSLITAACRHALIIHVFGQWCGHQPDPSLVVATAQHNLLSALRPLVAPPYKGTELLLWLLSVGGTCRQGHAQRRWFVSRLADAAVQMGVRTWPEMKGCLKRVIWHEYQDEKLHRELWAELETLWEEEEAPAAAAAEGMINLEKAATENEVA